MVQHIRRILRERHAGCLALVAGGVVFALVVGVVGSLVVVNALMATPRSARPRPMSAVNVPTATTVVPTATHSLQSTPLIPVNVRAYTTEGRMADGKWTHIGACAVSTAQFPLGTILNLYNADGSFNRQCLAEDTGGDIGYGQIDLAMPSDAAGATHWGRQNLWVRIVRWGWSGGGTPTALPTS